MRTDRIQDINCEIENLKNKITELIKEKESLLLEESVVSGIIPGDFLEVEEPNNKFIMKVTKIKMTAPNAYTVFGYSVAMTDQSFFINKNAAFTKHILFGDETLKITKITKDRFDKLATDMIKKFYLP